jgi:hypothetical protein
MKQNNDTIGNACFPQGDFGGPPEVRADQGGDVMANSGSVSGDTATPRRGKDPIPQGISSRSTGDNTTVAGPSSKTSDGQRNAGADAHSRSFR